MKTSPGTRREFLCSLGVALVTPCVGQAASASGRIPIAFSTLGCPKWNWRTVLDRAQEWGYAAIELRGLEGEMDLTKRPEFQGARLEESLKQLQDKGLKISDLGSSVRLHEAEGKVRDAQMDEGKRYIDLAHRLHAPFIRVFGDRLVAGQPKEAVLDRIVGGLRQLGNHAKESNVGVLLESHGDFCDSPTLLQILKGAAMPNVALLWDAHHTVVVGKEEPVETWRQVGRYVRHVHLKDSRPAGKDVEYVLTGQGTVPVRQTVQLLRQNGFSGYLSFEWEKAWHPKIEEPEVAFPHFAKVVREYWEQRS